MRPPEVPVIPNVTGEPTTELDTIVDALIEQLTGRVRWVRTMRELSGVDHCVEVGDSKALTGMLRTEGVRCVSMSAPASLRTLAGMAAT